VFDNNPSAYHCYKSAGFKETGEKFNIPLFEETWTVVELEMEKQDYEIYLATLRERNRIAREIHDNVGHMLSRSILQIGALKAH
jgi:signal transduction histidine kinase